MDRNKNNYCKKSIVRNTKKECLEKVSVSSIPKVIVGSENDKNTSNINNAANAQKEVPNLNIPKLNTILNMVQEMKQLENLNIKKSKALTKKCSTSIDEKVANKVNFPHDQNIYKDLITLNVLPAKKPPTTSTYRPHSSVKDIEPVLSDYFQPEQLPEYSFSVPFQHITRKMPTEHDGLRVYKIMRNWSLNDK